MAIAFRAFFNTSYAARTHTIVDKPTGTVDGDIMVVAFFAGYSSSNPPDIVFTEPAGWTQIGTTTAVTQGGGGFSGKMWVGWKRASSEGADYTFTHSTSYATQAVIASYSGCLASGSPVDVFTQNSGLTTTSTGLSVTTTVANTMLLYVAHNWTGSTAAAPSGMTERFDGLINVDDEARASAGATSNRTQTIADPVWQAYMVALKPAGATAYTVTADAGTYAVTGTNATLTLATPNKRINVDAGSYAIIGTAATPVKAGGGAAPVFRALSSTSYIQRPSLTTIAKPTGTLDGDIMLAGVFAYYGTSFDPDTDMTLTPPAGWTLIDMNQVTTGTINEYGRLWVYWKRAASEGSSYDFLHEGTNGYVTQGVIAAYSGSSSSGSPIDVYSKTAGTGTAATYTGVTTTSGNDKLVLLAHNWTGSTTLTPPTGMTERFDATAYAADETITSAGATGTRSHTVNSSSAEPWAGFLIGLKAGGSVPAYSITAEAGSYSLTGTDATFRRGLKVIADPAAYAMAGTEATPFKLSGGVPVFRSISSIAYIQRSVLTNVTKPTGTVDGDIMLLGFLGAAAVDLDVKIDTPPAGWTLIGTPVSQAETGGGFFGKFWVYWKRASSEPASYDFLHTTTMNTQATIASYSGCIPTGTPFNVFSQAAGVGPVATATSITTTIGNTKLVYTGHNWDGTGNLAAPFGMTERDEGLVYFADEDRVTAGATSDRTQNLASSNPWQAFLVALLPPGVVSPFAFPPYQPAAFLPFLVR